MEKMKFPTQYSRAKTIPSETGSGVAVTYSPVYDERGVWHLEPTGKKDLFSEIQSHKESCDINNILKRYASGEVDVLSRIQGFYADISDIPSDAASILNILTRAEEAYNKLPAEYKEKFNNSYTEFLASAGTDAYFEKLGITQQSDVIEKEVLSDANAE